MASRHLAIFLKGVAEKILSGEKQVEIRLSQNKVLPYGEVQKDDEIYLKVSGGKILGKVEVDNVLLYDSLDKNMMINIQKEYYDSARMDEAFWSKKASSRFATIIFLKNPKTFLTPVVYHKTDRRPWVVIEEQQ